MQASQVPSDVPVYPPPQGVFMGTTGYGEAISVAQMTSDPAATVIDWLKTNFPLHGSTLDSSTQAGTVTTLNFSNAQYRYTVNVESGAGGTFFTTARQKK